MMHKSTINKVANSLFCYSLYQAPNGSVTSLSSSPLVLHFLYQLQLVRPVHSDFSKQHQYFLIVHSRLLSVTVLLEIDILNSASVLVCRAAKLKSLTVQIIPIWYISSAYCLWVIH